MSILTLLMVLIVLPGMYRVWSGISGFLSSKLHVSSAKKVAFLVVLVSAAMFATPLLTLGLPAYFRLAAWGIYLVYVIAGGLYVWDFISGIGNRNQGPRS